MYHFSRKFRTQGLRLISPIAILLFLCTLFSWASKWIWDRLLDVANTWLVSHLLLPLVNVISTVVNWNNQDGIRWAWTFAVIWTLGIISVLAWQAYGSRGIHVSGRKAIGRRINVIAVRNATGEDLKDCSVQIIDIDPKLVQQKGIYDRLPGTMYWSDTSMQGNEQRISIDAGSEAEIVLGHTHLSFQGGGHYTLKDGIEYEGEFHFRGINLEGKTIQKWFGAKLEVADGNTKVTKTME